MSKFKDNPQEALNAVQEIADEIASSVSAEELGKMVPLLARTQLEVHDFLTHYLSLNLRENLSTLWAFNEVDDRLRDIKKLEEKAGTTPAWRPKTGVVESDAIEAACLLKTKRVLEAKIKDKKSKSDVMKRDISEFASMMTQQMREMQAASFTED